MRESVKTILDSGNISAELKALIDEYLAFERKYIDGEGDILEGLKKINEYEAKIIESYKKQ